MSRCCGVCFCLQCSTCNLTWPDLTRESWLRQQPHSPTSPDTHHVQHTRCATHTTLRLSPLHSPTLPRLLQPYTHTTHTHPQPLHPLHTCTYNTHIHTHTDSSSMGKSSRLEEKERERGREQDRGSNQCQGSQSEGKRDGSELRNNEVRLLLILYFVHNGNGGIGWGCHLADSTCGAFYSSLFLSALTCVHTHSSSQSLLISLTPYLTPSVPITLTLYHTPSLSQSLPVSHPHSLPSIISSHLPLPPYNMSVRHTGLL